jgi:hypothetical protein
MDTNLDLDTRCTWQAQTEPRRQVSASPMERGRVDDESRARIIPLDQMHYVLNYICSTSFIKAQLSREANARFVIRLCSTLSTIHGVVSQPRVTEVGPFC